MRSSSLIIRIEEIILKLHRQNYRKSGFKNIILHFLRIETNFSIFVIEY
jgi:hypothetical protein